MASGADSHVRLSKQHSQILSRRVCSLKDGSTYEGPLLSTLTDEEHKVVEGREPRVTFVDGQGRVYDQFYRPLGAVAEQPPPAEGEASLGEVPSMPEPDDFVTYDAYLRALLLWKDRVYECVDDVRLPLPLGGVLYRPARTLRAVNSKRLMVHTPRGGRDEGDNDADGPPGAKQRRMSRVDSLRARSASMVELAAPVAKDKEAGMVSRWESQLLPMEPDPRQYATYDEYTYALRRWATVCSTGLGVVPPHASQFEHLLHLNPVKAVRRLEDHYRDDGPTREEVVSTAPKIVAQNLWPTLPADVQERVLRAVEHVEEHSAVVQPVLHGVFDKTAHVGPSTRRYTDVSAMPRHSIDTESAPVLTAPFHDCPSEIDGRAVVFRPPAVHLEEQVRLDRLVKGDMGYLNTLRAEVELLDHADMVDELNSWYWPTVPEQFHRDRAEEMQSLLQQCSEEQDEDNRRALYRGLFTTPCFLDRFEEWMLGTMRSVGKPSPLLSSLTIETFRAVLLLMDDTHERLTMAKLSSFVVEVLRGNTTSTYLTRIVEEYDVSSLYYVARALSFYAKLPETLFRLNLHLLSEVAGVMGQHVGDITVLVTMSHYMRAILLGFRSQTSRGHFPIMDVSVQQHKSTHMRLNQLVREHPDFMQHDLFRGLLHGSSSVSEMFQFVTLEIMRSKDKAIQSRLRQDNPTLVDDLRELAMSPRSHHKRIVHTILDAFLEGGWYEVLLLRYGMDQMVEDFVHYPPERRPMLLAHLALPRFVFTLVSVLLQRCSITNVQALQFLADSQFFNKCVDRIRRDTLSKNGVVSGMTFMVARLMARIAYRAHRFSLIHVDLGERYKPRKGDPPPPAMPLCTVTCGVVVALFTVISKLPDHEYRIKTAILTTLRHLLKPTLALRLLQEQPDLMVRVLECCRDNHDVDFNRNAWRLFFQLIRYHADGLTFLRDIKKFPQFLELVGTGIRSKSGLLVVIHSLHYLTKIFLLISNEQVRMAKKCSTVSDVAKKSFEKTIKFLSEYLIKKQFFIRFHIMYRRYFDDAVFGAPFQKLAKLYFVILTSPYCAKLLRETQKNPDYRTELLTIGRLFGYVEGENAVYKVDKKWYKH